MRTRWFVFPLLVLLCAFPLAAAAAEQPSALPAAISALCAEQFPGYTVSAWDGGGNEQQGQAALVLSLNGYNVLCIAEKAADDPAYTFSVKTDTAVRQGADIPSLLIDTGGDALFYTYRDSDVTCTYNTNKSTDGWGAVGITVYRARDNVPDRETHYFYQNQCLFISLDYTDENDNITSSVRYAPVFAPWLEERFALPGFDIALLPGDDLYTPQLLEIFSQSALGALPVGYATLQCALTPYALMAEVQDTGGARTVVLLENAQDGAYAVTQSTPLPEGVRVDFGHSWSSLVVRLYPDPAMQENYNIYGFLQRADGFWYLHSAMTPDNLSFAYTPFGIDASGVWHVGSCPAQELTAMDWSALPATFAQALTKLDQSGWARVISDDPANNRLHLRAAPDSKSDSLGMYYQGTPVKVLGTQGGWTEVDIFGVHGYMMTKWLAFGTDMNGVDNAFIQLTYRGEALLAGVGVYASPGDSAPALTLGAQDSPPDPVILGVVEEEWVHVLFPDTGVSGYIRQADLWKGNG